MITLFLFLANTFNISAVSISLLESNVEDIEPGAFGNIKTIMIRGNNLPVIKKDAFTNSYVSSLILSLNKIEHIEAGAFVAMESLQYLDIKENLLQTFDVNAIFGGVVKLKMLNLQYNKIKRIENNFLTLMPELEILNISSNALEFIGDEVFEDLHAMETIDLSNNNLRLLHGNDKASKNNLQHLFLHNNNLTFLSTEFLAKLNNVKNVTLANNSWQCPCMENIDEWMKKNQINDVCEDEIHGCVDNGEVCYFDLEKSKYSSKNSEGSCNRKFPQRHYNYS